MERIQILDRLIQLEKKASKQENQIKQGYCGVDIYKTLDEIEEIKKQLTK